MKILHTPGNKKFIAYNKLITAQKKTPCVIFHHGLMSNMNSDKALYIEKHCVDKGYNFIRFDNFGHGDASGEFSDETISTWLEGLNLVINKLTETPILLVGSSMGGWITMLSALSNPQIIGVIAISAAPDFTEELIWDKATKQQQKDLETKDICEFKGPDPECDYSYPISYQLIQDGRKHLLLNKDAINITCKMHLIHGMQDVDVPFSMSQRLADKIVHNNVVTKFIKDGNHSLSRPQDLQIICNSIEEIMDTY